MYRGRPILDRLQHIERHIHSRSRVGRARHTRQLEVERARCAAEAHLAKHVPIVQTKSRSSSEILRLHMVNLGTFRGKPTSMLTSSQCGVASSTTEVLSSPTREPSASIAATFEFLGYLHRSAMQSGPRSASFRINPKM